MALGDERIPLNCLLVNYSTSAHPMICSRVASITTTVLQTNLEHDDVHRPAVSAELDDDVKTQKHPLFNTTSYLYHICIFNLSVRFVKVFWASQTKLTCANSQYSHWALLG